MATNKTIESPYRIRHYVQKGTWLVVCVMENGDDNIMHEYDRHIDALEKLNELNNKYYDKQGKANR